MIRIPSFHEGTFFVKKWIGPDSGSSTMNLFLGPKHPELEPEGCKEIVCDSPASRELAFQKLQASLVLRFWTKNDSRLTASQPQISQWKAF